MSNRYFAALVVGATALMSGILPGFGGGRAQAEIPNPEPPPFQGTSYSCDRGVQVPVVYVEGEKGGLIVLTVEGQQLTLLQEIAASGVRYGWPSDGESYVWWSKGQTASLYYKTPAGESVVYENCRQN